MSTAQMELGEVTMQVDRLGDGPPVLVLHGDAGPSWQRPLAERLAQSFSVHMPHHPGWGDAAVPPHMMSIRDVADVYTELLRSFEEPPAIVGVSVGGWIAARLASLCQRQPPALVLVSPLGLKLRGREDRDFVDLFVIGRVERLDVLYGKPPTVAEMAALSDDTYLELARAEEAMARYCWQPYLHDATMQADLRRIAAPTLVIHGESDRLVLAPNYYEEYARCIGGNATTKAVAGVGHRADEDDPVAVADLAVSFIQSNLGGGA